MVMKPNTPTVARNALAGVKDGSSSVAQETSAPSNVEREDFPIQSFLDDTLAEWANLEQPKGKGIIITDQQRQTHTLSLFGVANYPHSKVPLAVSFLAGGQKSPSGSIICPPGTVVRPHGIVPGQPHNAASGVVVGLPYGFQGGGLGVYQLLQTCDADVQFPTTSPEILVQRFRTTIIGGGVALPALVDAPGTWFNWPLGFPWQSARNLDRFPQDGRNIGRYRVTRVELRFRSITLAGGEKFDLYLRGTDDFDTGADGVTVSTTQDTNVGEFSIPGPGGVPAFPLIEVKGGPLCEQGGDFCRMDLVSTAVALIGVKVDVCRYGVIG